MMLYHGTDINKKKAILENGFESSYGEYGQGVYFAVNKELAYDYGDELIEVFIDDEYITIIDELYFSDIYPHSELENISYKNNYKAVMITYSNCKSSRNESEVCVYDKDIIEICQ